MDSILIGHTPVFPYEIYDIILRTVLDFETLLSCRLASKQLNSIATAILRRRHTGVKLTQEKSIGKTNLESIFEAYQDPGNLPWSSVRLLCRYVTQKEAESLLRFYGAYVMMLHVNPLDYNLDPIIEAVPNVQILNFNFSLREIEVPILSARIRNLKSIKIQSLQENSIPFLKGLLELSGSELQRISIELPFELPKFAIELVPLISKVHSISLTMNNVTKLHPAFLGKNLRIRKLYIRLSRYRSLDFGPLQSLLSEASSTIEKFTLICHSPLKGIPSLSIPKLSKLRKLELIHNNVQPARDRAIISDMPTSFDYINGLTTNQFPALESVRLVYSYGHSIFEGSIFASVREADLDEYVSKNIMLINWNQFFPNLKSLRATANEDTLQFILTSFTKLTELRLDLTKNRGVNTPLTAVPKPNVSTKAKVKNGFQKAMSLLPEMTELKVLELRFGEWRQVKGSTLDCALLQMKRLESLALYDVKFSDTSKQKLMEHHSNVTFE